ncbi:hypothetical protein J2X63_003472 [Agromyces sp. 3263]|uniref:glycosyl hydrolase n=1 Tax=Agromyces sp. 3263 TaxID=2817750 RepID=UPI0028582620|nr:glycosyl hydrolase [Agromyces sp. 3263]MDR6907764.1 hypothetical protein [Agromyces sp. 3263]
MEHASSASTEASDRLWDAFVDPPDEARPRAWWHWMDGNIDPEGIERDLRWLHAVGVRGAQVFDGGMGGPLVVPAPVRPGSSAWDEAVLAAKRTASELGIELAVATSSGWSAAGGPWVEPADAMKKVVWSELALAGGRPVEVPLPPLPSVAGLYQDSPRWDAEPDGPGWATDWRVLAFPADPLHQVQAPARFRASSRVHDWTCLTDGSFGRSLALPRDPDGWSTAWIEQEFVTPITVRSVVVGLPGPRGFGAAPPATAVLQASDDGETYRDVVELPADGVPARTASFPAVTARWFRLVLSGSSAAEALPPIAHGVRRPPVLRTTDRFEVSEFVLRSGGRVHRAEAKAGFGVVADYFAVSTDPRAGAGALHPETVIDVSEHVHDGVLRWNAPPGDWTILRLGASLTGQTNGPAPADATGLEVDKLDGDPVRAYLRTHLGRFAVDDEPGAVSTPRFGALLSDSIEAGPQNWTEAILEQFGRRRGYDPTPWLPALAGCPVGDPEASDRFLYDYRRTITELIADEYYRTLAAEAHRRGMTAYAEALEDGRPQLGDDLAMRSHADVPMGAMWTFDAERGPLPTYVADLKGASSVAHVQGRQWVGAEAFTSFDRPWSWTPRTLKHVADLQLSLGVTRFCIHTSPHQPIAAPPPGIALAPFLGQAFTINETWSHVARPWIDYLARCSAVLSMGVPAVDVAVFVGEEAPVTGLFGQDFDTVVPPGFDFDYVGVDALTGVLRVEDGAVVADGASYRLLYLGGSSDRMTLASLLAVEGLLDQGATVVGRRPTASPSLGDDADSFDRSCDRIWTAPRARGRVLDTSDLREALDELGLKPPLEVVGPPVRQISRVIDGRRVTFLANPSAEPAEMQLLVADSAPHLVAWDPVALQVQGLPHDGTPSGDGRRAYGLSLPSFGSAFVLGADADPPTPAVRSTQLRGPWELHLPGRPSTAMPSGPALWTTLDDEARGFSGTGAYSIAFDLADAPVDGDRHLVDLGVVRDIARVTVNDVDCGVAWTAPFQVEVTAALRAGTNLLRIEVTTPWRNRLIAEAAAASGGILEPMTQVFEPTAEPLPAGLAGPVVLLVESPG